MLFTPIDERHEHTGNCRHIVAGKLIGTAIGLAICQYESENGFYLFSCDESWNTLTDTFHDTLEEAKAHAEFEYKNVNATWQSLEE